MLPLLLLKLNRQPVGMNFRDSWHAQALDFLSGALMQRDQTAPRNPSFDRRHHNEALERCMESALFLKRADHM
jgi:hypothetical protein